jgi:hypothetical protein
LVLQEAASLSTHCPIGSTWLTGTLVQVPSVFGSAHDWQAPPHGALQQNPWAQERPVWHSAELLQTAPWPLSPQEFIELQVLGALHWSFVAQTLKHSDPLQTKGTQARESGATHWPVVLHVEAAVKTPLEQVWLAQTVPWG